MSKLPNKVYALVIDLKHDEEDQYFDESSNPFNERYYFVESLNFQDLEDNYTMEDVENHNPYPFVEEYSDKFSENTLYDECLDCLVGLLGEFIYDIDFEYLYKIVEYNPNTKRIKKVKDDELDPILGKYMDLLDANGPDSDMLSAKCAEENEKLEFFLLKCLNDNTDAVITMTNQMNPNPEIWSIKKENETLYFGPDQQQHEVFPYIFSDMIFATTSLIVRVFTSEKINNEPVKELYGFVITPECDFINLSCSKLKDVYLETSDTIEDNVIYCDLKDNKIPFFDLI